MRILKMKMIVGTIAVALISANMFSNMAVEKKILGGPKKQVQQSGQIYVVKEGDNVSSIALKFRGKNEKLSNMIARIQVENNINEIIYPGQKLRIPLKEI